MKRLLASILLMMLVTNVAYAGVFDDLVDNLPDSMKGKEMAKVEIPINGIKQDDARVKKIESLAIQVAMKHNWKLQIACPSDQYCKKIKKDVDAEAWRVARSKVSSDYAAKAKLPKIYMVKADRYHILLIRKGL